MMDIGCSSVASDIHSIADANPWILLSVGTLVIDQDNEVGIHLNSKVPASMRKDVYNVEVVATATKLLCYKCSCPCGSNDDQRIVCVHILVVLYRLSMLLMEDLAEHIMIALAT